MNLFKLRNKFKRAKKI